MWGPRPVRFEPSTGRSSSITASISSTCTRSWSTEPRNRELDGIYIHNSGSGEHAERHVPEPGDDIPINPLTEHNQYHGRNILEYEDDSFSFFLHTYLGDHPLKTVVLDEVLELYDLDDFYSGIWGAEQDERADETFFSLRHDPESI